MTGSRDLRSVLRLVASGYRNIALTLLQGVAMIAAAGIVGAVIVFPLWFAATRATGIYTISILGLVAAAVIVNFLRRIRLQRTGTFLPILKTAGRILLVFAGVYATIVLFARGLAGPAAALALAGLVWLGYAASGGRTRHNADEAPHR
jgi:small-conductance mechanosensitive channel